MWNYIIFPSIIHQCDDSKIYLKEMSCKCLVKARHEYASFRQMKGCTVVLVHHLRVTWSQLYCGPILCLRMHYNPSSSWKKNEINCTVKYGAQKTTIAGYKAIMINFYSENLLINLDCPIMRLIKELHDSHFPKRNIRRYHLDIFPSVKLLLLPHPTEYQPNIGHTISMTDSWKRNGQITVVCLEKVRERVWCKIKTWKQLR